MASNYNRYPRPAVVFVRDGVVQVAVERETPADMVRMDRALARTVTGSPRAS
jgi:diaminopimelate decarboxylase